MIQLPFQDLTTSLKTKQDVNCFLVEIETLEQTFFKSEIVSIEKALSSISTDSAQKIKEFFSKNNLDINDKDVVTSFFENLKKSIQSLRVIKLVLAFDPTCKTLENIHNFVKENIGSGYILEVEVSKDILGGAVVIFNGKYNDFSLKKDIEETFKENKSQIVSLVG